MKTTLATTGLKNNVQVTNALAQLLAEFQVHYTNLRNLHWNIKGHGFFVLHEEYEKMYDDVATKIDEVAERILQLGETPEHRFSAYLKQAQISELDIRHAETKDWLTCSMRWQCLSPWSVRFSQQPAGMATK